MWNNAVLDLHTGLLTAFRPLAATAHDHPVTVVGVALIFALLVAMLAAEIVDGRAAQGSTKPREPTEAVRRVRDT